jgi:signal transduction histidine kinase
LVGSIAGVVLFKPFNRTLDQIKGFRIDQEEPLNFTSTGTVEFNKLNDFLREMSAKVQRDYRSLREFTENASHEMQTPLTNAIGKLELLLTSGTLGEEDTSRVVATLGSLKHLSKMGQSLNLLTKIDNREFERIESVNFSQKLCRAIDNFRELMELKSISLENEHQEDVMVSMDPTLTTILVNNLFSNAIRHNREHGYIKTLLDQKGFTITNPGEAPDVDPNTLFDRFRKSRHQSEGLGLGLAIVKKICDYSDFSIDYTYQDGEHKLEIRFNT